DEGPPCDNTHALRENDRLRKTLKYRLYPNTQQQRLLEQPLEECRWLYHHLLAPRRAAWQQRQEAVRLSDQPATVPALNAERPRLSRVQSPVVQTVARRLDLAWQACLRRARTGAATPGSPRFRGTGRYDSLTFPQVPVGCQGDP